MGQQGGGLGKEGRAQKRSRLGVGGGGIYQSCSDKGQTPESQGVTSQSAAAPSRNIFISLTWPAADRARPSWDQDPKSGAPAQALMSCVTVAITHPLWSQFPAPRKTGLKKHPPGFLLTQILQISPLLFIPSTSLLLALLTITSVQGRRAP